MWSSPAVRHSTAALAAAAVVAITHTAVDAQSDDVRARMFAGTVRVINELMFQGQPVTVTGSGVLLGRGDYVATNWHVVDADEDGRFDGTMSVAALVNGQVRVVRADEAWHALPVSRDVVILRLAEPFLDAAPPISLFAAPADQVWAVGFPGVSDAFGSASQSTEQQQSEFLQPTVNLGNISRVHESTAEFGGGRVIQHQVPINQGNSGGPLFDACGALVGLNNAGSKEAQGTNFAIHVTEVLTGLRRLEVPFTTAPRCDPGASAQSAATRTAWPMWLALGLSFAVAGTALAFSVTSRGRAAVRRVSQRWSVRHVPLPAPPAPAGAGAGGALPGPVPPGVYQAGAGAPAAHARLRGVAGEFNGLELEIGGEPIIFGRDPAIRGVVFLGDESSAISKRHCEVRYDATRRRVTVTDLSSSNGTFVGDVRLTPYVPRDLNEGDRIALGSPHSAFDVSVRNE